MKHLSLFEEFEYYTSQQDIYKKLMAPDEITIEITEKGKTALYKLFSVILKQSQPDIYRKDHPSWLPSTTVDLADKITLPKKFDSDAGIGIGHREHQFKIGSMQVTQDRHSAHPWISLSPLFKYNDGGRRSTDTINLYAFYIPFEGKTMASDDSKNDEGARIQINAGVNIPSSQPVGNFDPFEKGDYFEKIEVGVVSTKGYFKIIGVK